MIDACIFDLDGVIVDTAKYHYIAWKEMAASVGVDFTPHHNESLKGVGRMESLDYILKICGVDKTEEERILLAEAKNRHYLSLILDMNEEEILPGVKDFLLELKAHDIKIALGSSSKNAQHILIQCGIVDLFEVIIDGTKTTRTKPDPQVFQMGAEALQVAPSQTVVFEDAIKGIEAAKAGGFFAVGVGDPQELELADYNITDFRNFKLEDLGRLKTAQ